MRNDKIANVTITRSQAYLHSTVISQLSKRRTTCGQSAMTTIIGTQSRLTARHVTMHVGQAYSRAVSSQNIDLRYSVKPRRSITQRPPMTLSVCLWLLLLLLRMGGPALQVPQTKNAEVVPPRCLSAARHSCALGFRHQPQCVPRSRRRQASRSR
jgi:hypothetical protein